MTNLRQGLSGEEVEAGLAGLTLAIAVIPEEFPMVLTVFLALGSWRLAKHNVLVRRGAAIEALGQASVLCVDKTGTLTENHMRLAQVWRAGQVLSVTSAAGPSSHRGRRPGRLRRGRLGLAMARLAATGQK